MRASVRPFVPASKPVPGSLAAMSDQPNTPTQAQYYSYLVRLNKHLSEIRMLLREVTSHANLTTDPEFEPALSTLRKIVADTVAVSIDHAPGV